MDAAPHRPDAMDGHVQVTSPHPCCLPWELRVLPCSSCLGHRREDPSSPPPFPRQGEGSGCKVTECAE